MRALVLIPGFMGGPQDWAFQIDAFSHDRAVTVPLHHRGLSSISDMATDIASRLPDEFDLVAWSMGGYIALELHRLVAHRVVHFALVSTGARPESDVARARRLDMLSDVCTGGMRPVLERQFDEAVATDTVIDADYRERVIAAGEKLGAEVMISQVAAMGSRRDQRPYLASINTDTLVVAGGLDGKVPAELTNELASRIPRAQLAVIDDVGHAAPFEKPLRFNDLLMRFLSS